MYLNDNILSTRGFHVDGYHSSLKGFVYSKDVFSLDQGPFCYVKGSHIDNDFMRANKALTKNTSFPTEALLLIFLKSRATPNLHH